MLHDRSQITRKATCPPEASIHVKASKASFSTTVHTVSSQRPQPPPPGRLTESQKVKIASATSSIDWPANPVKQKLSTFACWLLSARKRRLSVM